MVYSNARLSMSVADPRGGVRGFKTPHSGPGATFFFMSITKHFCPDFDGLCDV